MGKILISIFLTILSMIIIVHFLGEKQLPIYGTICGITALWVAVIKEFKHE